MFERLNMFQPGNIQSPFLNNSSVASGTNPLFPPVPGIGLSEQTGAYKGLSLLTANAPKLPGTDQSVLSREAMVTPQVSTFTPPFMNESGLFSQVGIADGQGMIPGMMYPPGSLQEMSPMQQTQTLDFLNQFNTLVQQSIGGPGASSLISGGESLRDSAYAAIGSGSLLDAGSLPDLMPTPGNLQETAYSILGYSALSLNMDFSTIFDLNSPDYSMLGLSLPGFSLGAAEISNTEREAQPQENGRVAPLDNYTVTSEFGHRFVGDPRFDGFHNGIDLGAPLGSPVKSIQEGVISRIGNDPEGYGNWVEVTHPDGTRTRYGHLHNFADIRQGQTVSAGTVLGGLGSTGNSSGPHLHFEVIDSNGRNIDPRNYLKF
jgi:hypothetical protein